MNYLPDFLTKIHLLIIRATLSHNKGHPIIRATFSGDKSGPYHEGGVYQNDIAVLTSHYCSNWQTCSTTLVDATNCFTTFVRIRHKIFFTNLNHRIETKSTFAINMGLI